MDDNYDAAMICELNDVPEALSTSQGFLYRVQDLGFRVKDLGFRVGLCEKSFRTRAVVF